MWFKERGHSSEPFEFKFARSYRSVDKNTLVTATHRVGDNGEVGEVIERDGTKMIQKLNRKKPE